MIPSFVAALAENEDIALRIAQWSRDVRGGAGERQLYRDILKYLETNKPELAEKLLKKTPEVGRWDDIFIFESKDLRKKAFNMLGDALRAKNGLAAKWTPRKGPIAAAIREHFGMSPKFYRKSLVELTNVVETQMCAKQWEDINFSHVPSVASSRYKKAFTRNSAAFVEYVAALTKGTDPTVKVNASSIFPYEILKRQNWQTNDVTVKNHTIAQWNALPNYVGDASILPVVDVSGSMTCPAGGEGTVSCLDVAVSIGLYLADKNKGAFNGTFLTFSDSPVLTHLKGDIIQKAQQMERSEWGMSTNLHAAFDAILKNAMQNSVPPEDMPKIIMIMSDMQFNCCTNYDDSAIQMIERKYRNAGYEAPKVVFWNINAKAGTPVAFDKSGAALVSGFSPSIIKPILKCDFDGFTPESIMRQAVCIPRYDL